MFDFGNRKDLSNATNEQIIEHLLTAENPIFIVAEGLGHIVGSDTVEDLTNA